MRLAGMGADRLTSTSAADGVASIPMHGPGSVGEAFGDVGGDLAERVCAPAAVAVLSIRRQDGAAAALLATPRFHR
ncbi:hypothetical protein DQ237_12945 [Blastococcus sp. TF02-8]|nr:hypothetical protein DQ237_12945 [Blastococcus sp. TF02-8]